MGANSIIKENILVKETIRLLDKSFVIINYANTEFEGEIKKVGDTVSVQTFPRISHSDGTQAGADIPVSEFEIKKETLTVDTLKQCNVPVSDYEELISNLNLVQKTAEQIRYDMVDKMEQFVATTAIAGADITPASVALTKSNVFDVIVGLSTSLSKNNVPKRNRALFFSPDVTGLLLLHPLFDGTREGLETREEGFVGRMAGFKLYETNNITGNKMLAMDKDSVHFVAKWVGFDTRKATNGFRTHVISEFAMGSKVFDENAKRIAVQEYTLS